MKKKILYLTDLYYKAKGRNYYEEDLWLTGLLKDYFDVVLCHPVNSESFEKDVDLIIFRNTGGVSGFKDVYEAFVKRVKTRHLKTFNEFTGKADMMGKQYLLDLNTAGYPVIPTVDTMEDICKLPDATKYVIKPKDGADSIGLEFLLREELEARELAPGTMLIQPMIDFQYELSFYFINDKFEYALYAPDKSKRWALEKYDASSEDIAFATKFIRWNSIIWNLAIGALLRTQISHISIWFVVNRTPYSHSPTDSAYALLNFALGCLHRGQRQSSGKSSKVTPSCSAGS